MTRIILLFCLLPFANFGLFAQNPVILQPWVEVFGDSLPEQTWLGNEVRGFVPQPNFNYRSGVSMYGYLQPAVTGLYKNSGKGDISATTALQGTSATLADLNGDGKMDLIIRRNEKGIVPDTVVIYWGTAAGLDSANPTKLIGEDKYDGFGSSICLGNIVGDSITDLVITAPYYPKSAAQGKVYIYRGSPQFSTTPYITLLGDSINYGLGSDCAIGDVNNDGYNDLIIRGYYGSRTPYHAYVDIYWGGASFDTIRGLRMVGGDNPSPGLACFDVNGDGIDDLLWSNTDSVLWVYVHYGGKNFSTTPNLRLRNPASAIFGEAIINAGDMNGDGYNDIAVGSREGQVTSYVFVFSGGPQIDGEVDAYYEISQSQFGSTVAAIGDINGDGLCDIIVGAPTYPFEQNRGYWGIFLGSKNIPVTSVRKGEPPQPKSFELYQNYPNPFNGQTVISYQLKTASTVRFRITNTLGQEITTINEGEQGAGRHQIPFDGKNLASGWYVYTITVTPIGSTRSFTQSKAMILDK